MEVFEYNKCLLTRLEESAEVLKCASHKVVASDVASQWAYYAECYIEPKGWQALWAIPRLICEELDIKHPTTVFGVVEEVLFHDLKVVFTVLAVDEVIELPKNQLVNIIDLWPTKDQENEKIDAERTADCIDKLRFFYNHIWMPWDNDCDDDVNWVEKHLQPRIRFFFDLKRKDMKRCVAAHIRTLILEAKYIQSKREYLEMDLSDNGADTEDENQLDESQITDLMRMHFRLSMIKSELEMLENPTLRRIYENIMFDSQKYLKHALKTDKKELRRSMEGEKAKVYIVTGPYKLEEQMKYLEKAKEIVEPEKYVQMCKSLMDVLDFCNASDQIYVPPGVHQMKFLEYFNDDGLICGLTPDTNFHDKEQLKRIPDKADVVITTQDSDSILLIFDGNFTLKNLVLDCRTARCGAMVKSGTILIENCLIIGDGKSSTKQGLAVCGEGNVILKNCLIKDLAQGIVIQDDAKILVKDSTVYNCRYGLQVEDGTQVIFDNASFVNTKNCGIYYLTNCLNNKVEEQKIVYTDPYAMKEDLCEAVPWSGECSFDNAHQNIILVNKQASLVPQRIEDLLTESTQDIRYSSFHEITCQQNGNGSDVSFTSAGSDIIDVDDESVVFIE